jgi:hypothetical protein
MTDDTEEAMMGSRLAEAQDRIQELETEVKRLKEEKNCQRAVTEHYQRVAARALDHLFKAEPGVVGNNDRVDSAMSVLKFGLQRDYRTPNDALTDLVWSEGSTDE